MGHEGFATVTRGLRRESPAMILYEKAKRLGIWNPSDINFTQDKLDWKTLTADESDMLLRLTSMFQAGEEAVTLDLLPLMRVIAREGRIEEELFLTTFLWEEGKHVDFFHRFISEVTGETGNLERYHNENYRHIFYDKLPEALGRLETDGSAEALARAATTYNLVIEGILAETGYQAYFTVLDRLQILPGQRKGIVLLKQDESRHIAYGIFLLSRLMAEDPSLWDVVEETMNELLAPALGVVSENFKYYNPVPFGLKESDFTDFAMLQFSKRLERVRKAREMRMDDLCAVTREIIEAEDA